MHSSFALRIERPQYAEVTHTECDHDRNDKKWWPRSE
jgi:hypothetical protein